MQKFLIVILDYIVFQRCIIYAYTQILNRDMEVFLRTCAETPKSIAICIIPDQNQYLEYLRTYAEYVHVSMRYLLICADNPVLDNQNHILRIHPCVYVLA